jgi:hypothetical protein
MIEITLRITRGNEIDIFGAAIKTKGEVLQAASNLLRKYDNRLEGSKLVFVKGKNKVVINAMASDDMIREATKKL